MDFFPTLYPLNAPFPQGLLIHSPLGRPESSPWPQQQLLLAPDWWIQLNNGPHLSDVSQTPHGQNIHLRTVSSKSAPLLVFHPGDLYSVSWKLAQQFYSSPATLVISLTPIKSVFPYSPISAVSAYHLHWCFLIFAGWTFQNGSWTIGKDL